MLHYKQVDVLLPSKNQVVKLLLIYYYCYDINRKLRE